MTRADGPGGRSIRVVVVAGVAGSGKTTVGEALADRLGWDYIEGDTLHPPANVEKMSRGAPLDDRDRAPWLDALRAEIEARIEDGRPAVLASSALRGRYRDALLTDHPNVLLVFLSISRALARQRLGARASHFFGPELVDSQFAALEPPEEGLSLPGDWSVERLVGVIADALLERGG